MFRFDIAGSLVLVVALLSIGFQTIMAAIANPVYALRCEEKISNEIILFHSLPFLLKLLQF